MGGNAPRFSDLMMEAHRATVALDALTGRDKSRAATAAVTRSRRVYSELLDYRHTARMTQSEANALQIASEQLRARLRLFGEDL